MNIKFIKKATAMVASVSLLSLSVLPLSVSNAAALTSVRDTMSRQQISVNSAHTIVFTVPGTLALTNEIRLTIPTTFGLGSVVAANFTVTSSGTAVFNSGSYAFTPGTGLFVAPVTTAGGAGETVTIAIASTNITNPTSAGTYTFNVAHTTASGASTVDSASFAVPVMDDDTVEVTGYIQDLITFDIDTTSDIVAATNTQCDAVGGATPCEGHSNPVAAGAFDNAGYVVSLGNLITSDYNISGDTVVHQDGNSGQINTIDFDLTANVSGGVTVTVQSLNGQLNNGGSNIPSPVGGSTVDLNSVTGYGIQYRTSAASTGAITAAAGYNGGAGVVGGVDTTPTQIFNSGAAAVQGARVLFNVGARPDALDATGTYTDQLTFVAAATF